MRAFLLLAILTVAFAANGLAGPTSNPAMYPFGTCAVCGMDADGTVVRTFDDRSILVCSESCATKTDEDRAEILARLDAAIVAAQKPIYPMTTCVVSGDPLGGDMGDPIELVHGNRLVRLCCEPCVDMFNEDPVGYIAKLDAAVVKASADTYAATTCPISGAKLGAMGEPYDYVFAGRLVRFCCGGCIDTFDADPISAMAKVEASK